MIKKLTLGILFSIIPFLSYSIEKAYNLPQKVSDISRSVISLNGDWQFKRTKESNWNTIKVPGEAVMQGYGIEHDKAFFYKKEVNIPSNFNNYQTILRFDGVYSYAKLSVNGKFVREHKGGFTRWETIITPYIKPGESNTIELEIIDPVDEISYASGYAHHPVGGILRDVTLYVLPDTHLYNWGIETHLDKDYKDAELKIQYNVSNSANAEVEYLLTDNKGKSVKLNQNVFRLNEGININSIAVSNPLKWDAEHPNLYRLTAIIKDGKKELYRFSQDVGFREVKIVGDRLLVNGLPVKLRGACRHDIHPTLGRTTTADIDSLDALLFKESNMNFVRTSHYPPSERFVEFCNKYGIYVEAESAVCFVNTHRQKNYAPGATQNSPEHEEQYLSQCREMLKTFRSHPSVIIWSIGNESHYGSNFQKSWDWVKAEDTTRPVIWSYPGAQGGDAKIYDILSMHYQDVYGNLSQWGKTTHNFQGHGIPALFDEWAHPACYTFKTLRDDPNIREFWGKSIDMMWSGLFPTSGGLGGGIWGYVDETFMVPALKEGTPFWFEFARSANNKDYYGQCIGYGEWGIVDVWRRKKPEFWSTKKAHSPVQLLIKGKVIENFVSGIPLNIPVYNRFDHTNMDEITGEYTYKGKTKTFKGNSLPPHQKGVFVVPAENWTQGEKVRIRFYDTYKNLIDAYEYSLGEEISELPVPARKGNINVKDSGDKLIVSGDNFEIPFSKTTGLIENAVVDGKVIIEKGPFLNMYVNLNHLSGAEVRKSADKYVVEEKDWVKTNLTHNKKDNTVLISLSGKYKNIMVDINFVISATGKIDISYNTQGEPNGYLRETGLKFHLSDNFSSLKWKRDGYWNYYPEGEFAGNTGETQFVNNKQAKYGERPTQDWHQDTHNYFYWGDKGAGSNNPLTQKAKGMKENIYYYTLSNNTNLRMSVISGKAGLACRMDRLEDEQLILYVNNQWDYPEIAWGNYCKRLEASPCYGTISIVF